MKIIFLGAPGAGKGTQAELVAARLAIPTISTGAIIRSAIAAKTEMGLAAAEFTSKGALVPDDVVIGIIRERLAQPDCENGFILDGFPRTVPQAEALERMGISIDRVVSIEVSDERIVQRMSGRRVCAGCGATYHTVYGPSKQEGICDACGAPLIIRADDAEEVVVKRLEIYHETTEPLKEFYSGLGVLKIVEGQEKIEDTTALTFSALGIA